jgi:hypothetical protein
MKVIWHRPITPFHLSFCGFLSVFTFDDPYVRKLVACCDRSVTSTGNVVTFLLVFPKLNRGLIRKMRVFCIVGCSAMHIMHAHAQIVMHVYYEVESVVGDHGMLFLSIVIELIL